MTDEFDIIIKNGLIVDGTGAPGYKGSLGVKDQRITALSKEDIKGDAKIVIDAKGMAVTPGFIDVHNHGDLSILYYPKAEGFLCIRESRPLWVVNAVIVRVHSETG